MSGVGSRDWTRNHPTACSDFGGFCAGLGAFFGGLITACFGDFCLIRGWMWSGVRGQ